MSSATDTIYRNTFRSKRYTLQRHRRSASYIVVMQKQKLHHFCNRSFPDNDPKSGRKYLGYKQLRKIHQSIPAEYYKINTAIWKDQQENTAECCEQYWTSLGGSTPQSSICTDTYHPSRRLSKLDEPDMRDTAGEVVIYKAICFDVAEGRMNGAPNETRTHWCRFASLAC